MLEPYNYKSHNASRYLCVIYVSLSILLIYRFIYASINNESERVMTAGSYVDVFQVQGVQILMVSLPQYRRPPLPRDGTSQHSALANCHGGNAHLLVIRKGEQVHICWQKKLHDVR